MHYYAEPVWRKGVELEAQVLIDQAELEAKRAPERVPEVGLWGREHAR